MGRGGSGHAVWNLVPERYIPTEFEGMLMNTNNPGVHAQTTFGHVLSVASIETSYGFWMYGHQHNALWGLSLQPNNPSVNGL